MFCKGKSEFAQLSADCDVRSSEFDLQKIGAPVGVPFELTRKFVGRGY